MIIPRKKYLDMLVAGLGNGLVKIVTGGRRCGKSFLLFTIFHNYLLEQGIEENHIIELSLDDRKVGKYSKRPRCKLGWIECYPNQKSLIPAIYLVD